MLNDTSGLEEDFFRHCAQIGLDEWDPPIYNLWVGHSESLFGLI